MSSDIVRPQFLSTMPAGHRQRRLALAVVLISLLVFGFCLPVAQVQLPAVPAFIPMYESTLAINDLITASLLFVQFGMLRSRALLAIACGYLFAAAMVIPHALTFPGLFSPTGLLGAGPQSTAWLYMFWHAGFSTLVILYAALKGTEGDTKPIRGFVHSTVIISAAIVLLLAFGLTLLTTAGQAALPSIMTGNNYTATMNVVVAGVGTLILLALFILLARRPHTVLDLWLMVVMCVWIFDVSLSAIFNAGRFDLGFYAGRIYGLLASTFVLLVLLFETEKLYAQLLRLFEAEQVEHRREMQEGRRIFDTTLDLILVTDRQGNFMRVSPSSAAILGYQPQEMTGHSAAEFICPDDLEPTRNEMRLARRGHETRNFETRYVHKDGRLVTLAWTGVWSEPEQRHFFIGRDMTQQKLAEKALRQEVEERKHVAEVLNNTISSMVEPVLVADDKGKILVANPAAQKIFGKLTGVDVDTYELNYERFYTDGVTPFPFEKTALYRSVRGESIDDLEFVIRHKGSKTPIHLICSGRPIRNEKGALQGAVTIYRDVTEKKRTQQALRESDQMARGIIDTALDAFLQLDDKGTILDWSPKAEAMFGWSRQEIIGKNLGEMIISPANRLSHEERMAQFLRDWKKGQQGERFEAPSLRRDGTEIQTEVSLTALRRGDGHIINGFIRDITDAIAAEAQLRHAQKMESIGQLTGGVAHDFNNMLTVITGTIDILAEAVADKPQLAAIAKLISEAADRGAELTGHLLAFARKQPLQPRETDINALMTASEKLLRPALGEQVEIELALESEVLPALVDPSQLTTALLNLAVNARDAMPDGGKLTLETGNVVLDQDYVDANVDVRAGDYVMIAVSDTGGGIPEAIRQKIFEPFFTTKGVGQGTGLGLSMVYGFVKQSGGHIKVYSEEGHGTTFKIYLPRAGEMPKESVDASRVSSIDGGAETILVVEDDPMVLTSVTAQLVSLGYNVLSAANATEALAMADNGTAFDLLFTDVIMPGPMNGRQLAEAMAQRRTDLKVLFTSGYTESAVIHHGRLDPGVLLLTKPYRKQDLARMLRRALEGEIWPGQPNEQLKSQLG
jgi:PAS domain S-box-containing protein